MAERERTDFVMDADYNLGGGGEPRMDSASAGPNELLNRRLEVIPLDVIQTVHPVDQKKNNKADRNKEIQSSIEMITLIKKMQEKKGLQKISRIDKREVVADIPQTKVVLGRGSNTCGGVYMLLGSDTQNKKAYKTILLANFHGDEIKAWVHLMDEKMAPELYQFKLEGNKVTFTMQLMEGYTLRKVVDECKFTDRSMARTISLCILSDLLATYQSLRTQGYTHGDMHGDNVMLLKQDLAVRLIDFDQTRQLFRDTVNDSNRIKNDLVGIIRMFCALYSSVDYNSLSDAIESLKKKDFKELSKYMQHISEQERKELFTLMSLLFDTVASNRQEGYGDTSQVQKQIQESLPHDVLEWKKKAAIVIFPEKFQDQDESDGGFEAEIEEEEEEEDDIWEHPLMKKYMANVTLNKLEELML